MRRSSPRKGLGQEIQIVLPIQRKALKVSTELAIQSME
jgi:hypothetical protein